MTSTYNQVAFSSIKKKIQRIQEMSLEKKRNFLEGDENDLWIEK